MNNRVGKLLPSSHSVGVPQNWLVGLTKKPMEIATSRLGEPKEPTQPVVICRVAMKAGLQVLCFVNTKNDLFVGYIP